MIKRKKIEKNEIEIILKVNKSDLNQKIYFLGNNEKKYCDSKEKQKSICNYSLQEYNERNTRLFIDNQYVKFAKYFIPKRSGIYRIKLVFVLYIKTCQCMFYNCKNIITIDLSLFNSKNVIDMSKMFYGCSNLASINLSNLNTKKVTNMRSLFFNCHKLTEINLSMIDTKNVEDMTCMFYDCRNLTQIDLSFFNTENVKEMRNMFYCCNNLSKIDLSSFNVQNVRDMGFMFAECKKLRYLDLSSFDLNDPDDINLESMFFMCINLIVKIKRSCYLKIKKNAPILSFMFIMEI